ncbi:MAG: hypothetical protein C0392_05870 [Syntrophus sp. (in: bacteria)]|nr:hypothetical protein [Syntrophus sp. (in: bacteria)]
MKDNQRNFMALLFLMLVLFMPSRLWALDLLPPPDFPLLEAVKKGNIEEVKSILGARGTKPPLISSNDEIKRRGMSGDTPLSLAAKYGNLEIVTMLVEHGAEIDGGRENTGRTPLMEASGQGHVEVVKYLISKGADVNAGNSGVTPLLEACRNVLIPYGPQGDKKKTIDVLLEKGAEVNVQDESWMKTGRTPLMYAVLQGDAVLVQTLLSKGARLDLKNKDGDTALSLAKKEGLEYIAQLLEKAGKGRNESSRPASPSLHPLLNAAKEGNYGKVNTLLSEGADVNVRAPSGSAPLMYGADSNRLDIVRLLLDKGADVNAKNGTNNTALIYASIKGNTEIVKELLEKKADVNVKNMSGGDALIYAVLEKRTEVVRVLLKNRAKVDEKYDSGKTALIMAVENGVFDIARLLLDNGAVANALDLDMKTPLIYASEKGDIDIVKALVGKGADVNAKSKYGDTALDKAISQKHVEVARFLINSGADIKSSSPLISAVTVDSRKIVEILLEKGADINKRGWEGKTPLMYAAAGEFNMVKYLVEKGADVNIRDNEDKTALMAAVESFNKSNISSIRFLIEKGADCNGTNSKGETALILASKRGDADIVRVLLEKGSNVSEKDKTGKTAWIYAVEGSHGAIISLLKKAGTTQDYEGMEWKGHLSNQKVKFIKAVETKEEWNALWGRAFDKPAPDIDFNNYFVACVFLGHSADWLYSIWFNKPVVRGNQLVITYGLGEIMLKMSGPFKAGGQYHMKVIKRMKGLMPLLEEIEQRPSRNRIL